MSGNITFNPFLTTSPANSFLLESQGYVQGTAYDDPSVRMELMGGTLASTETVVMWGGVPVEELINVTGSGADGTGPSIKRATTATTTTGWSVYNQAGSMVIVPGPSAPIAAVGNYVAFFRNASNIRIAVQADPALVAALVASDGSISSQALYWDVTNYRITLTTSGGNWALPTSVRLLSVNTNSKVVSYDSGTGAVTWVAGDAAIILV